MTIKSSTKRSQKKAPAKKSSISTKKTAAKKTSAPKKISKPGVSKKTLPKEDESALISKDQEGFPVVGIGASAGGLQAFEEFFNAMPSDKGMAFVLIAHLAPNHVSILPELVQKRTPMKVVQIEDGMKVQPNCVYVIPPNRGLAIFNGTLQLLDSSPSFGANMPIDKFFRSLAEDQGSRAVCIILSGTGSDGTIGLKAIKGELGMVMVQDEKSAKYDGMPRNAIATNLADYVLPPKEMPEQLIKYTKHMVNHYPSKIFHPEKAFPDAMQKILLILRDRTHHDFSLYKKNTLCRRIERRMSVHQLTEISDYMRYLQENDGEVHILFKELLIGVTNFFRDPDAFDILKETIIPGLVQRNQNDSTFRVWVPGCSSGEEAYSIAILLHEYMEKTHKSLDVQIFGTDIDEDAINVARAGFYPASIIGDVSEDRLKRYFIKEDSGKFQIKKIIREMLVFAPQNIIKDPPFTRLDLLCCRNLLIYFGPELQHKLIPIFHYSLRNEGILFLGSSETIGKNTELFSLADKKWKLYKRKPLIENARMTFRLPTSSSDKYIQEPEISSTIRKAEELSTLQLVQTILQQSPAPPCVIIDDALNLLYVHGHISKFLEPPEGKISFNVLDMARPGLKKELLEAISKVRHHKQEVIHRDIQIEQDGIKLQLTLNVKPILDQSPIRGLMMAVFQETSFAPQTGKSKPKLELKPPTGMSVEELEKELQHTKEDLQTTIEELETSNEELKSANEELQSTNEELQSTNEEMETSKEELQSLNEEAVTANAELQSRIDQMATVNDDLKNLLDSMEAATIFLDMDLCIRRYTPRITDIISLTGTDIGRPINHFALHLVGAIELSSYAEKVIADLAIIEEETQSIDGKCYRMRLRPYRTINNVIDGVVITFQDISDIKKYQQEKAKVKVKVLSYCKSIVNTIHGSMIVLDSNLKVMFANNAFYTLYQSPEQDTVNHKIYNLGNGQWNIPELRDLLENVLPQKTVIENYRVEHDFEIIGKRVMLLNASKLVMENLEEEFILLGIHNITEDSNNEEI